MYVLLVWVLMLEKGQSTKSVRAKLRDQTANRVCLMVGWRVPETWNVDPAHPREVQSLDLTLLQVVGEECPGS